VGPNFSLNLSEVFPSQLTTLLTVIIYDSFEILDSSGRYHRHGLKGKKSRATGSFSGMCVFCFLIIKSQHLLTRKFS
jgi:hypothetical protein